MFETHAHYNLKNFDCDRERLLQQIKQEGVEKIVIPAIGYETNAQSLMLFEKYDWIYYSVGIHPNFVGTEEEMDAIWEEGLTRLAKSRRVVAIGETGLDYHRFDLEEDGTLTEQSRLLKERQKVWFHKQLQLALRQDLPLVLHIRAAHEDGLGILKGYQFPNACPGVIHCFNGNTQEALEYVDMGFMVGLGGSVTFGEEELVEAVRNIPMENIVLETDAPYVLPCGLAGKRNTSLNLPIIAKKIAEIKEISKDVVEKSTTKNAMRLFRITNEI